VEVVVNDDDATGELAPVADGLPGLYKQTNAVGGVAATRPSQRGSNDVKS
jgi:hypothetical protein